MSFRLIPTRSFIRACANLSRPTPAIKTVYRMQYQYVRPTYQNLCYTQSRGYENCFDIWFDFFLEFSGAIRNKAKNKVQMLVLLKRKLTIRLKTT